MGSLRVILIRMLMVFGCTTTILARDISQRCADFMEVSSPPTTSLPASGQACASLKPGELEDVIHQMEMVDQVEFGRSQELFILLDDNYSQELESVLEFLTNGNRTTFRLKKSENKGSMNHDSILQLVRENIRQYSRDFRTYFIYRKKHGLKYDVFERYFLQRVIDNSQEIRVSDVIYHIDNTLLKKIAKRMNELRLTGDHYDFHKKIFSIKILLHAKKINEMYHNLILSNSGRLFEVFKCLETQVSENLTSNFNSLAETIHTHYLDFERLNVGVPDFRRIFIQKSDDLSKQLRIISNHISREESITELTTESLTDFFSKSKIKFPENLLSRFMRNLNYFIFSRSVTGVKIRSSKLIAPLEKIIKNNIELSASWYKDLSHLYAVAPRCVKSDIVPHQILEFFPKQIYAGADNLEVKKMALTHAENYILTREIKPECIFKKEHYPKMKNDLIRLEEFPAIGKIVKLLTSSTPVRSECRRVGQYEYVDILQLLEITEKIALREYNRLLIFTSENYEELPRIFSKGKEIYYVYSKTDEKKNEAFVKLLVNKLSDYVQEIRMVANDTLLREIRLNINLPLHLRYRGEVERIFHGTQKVDKSFLRPSPDLSPNVKEVIQCLLSSLLDSSIPAHESLATSAYHHVAFKESNSTDLSILLDELKTSKEILSGKILESLENGLELSVLSKLPRRSTILTFIDSLDYKMLSHGDYDKLVEPLRNIIAKTSNSLEWYVKLNGLYTYPAPYWDDKIRNKAVRNLEYLEMELKDLYDADMKRKHLNHVKEIIFGQKKECIPVKDAKSDEEVYKLLIHGNSIRFRDIPYGWDYICNGRIGILELFARHKIIIDKDFDNLGKTLQFVAIAPKLVVVGDRTIRLDSGARGEPVGIFIGISEEIISGNMPRIFANGGRSGMELIGKHWNTSNEICVGCIHTARVKYTDGPEGETGKNGDKNNRTHPEFEGFKDFGQVVNDYKNLIRPYMNKNGGNEVLSRFYEGLTKNEGINAKYSTVALLEELKELEKHFQCLTGTVDLLPMYTNLRERIEEYAKQLQENGTTKDNVAALTYAKVAIVAISNRIKEKYVFVTDLRTYLTKVKFNFEQLSTDNMQYTANQLHQDYQKDIKKKIKEAKKIINIQLKQEVVNLNKQMRNKVSELFDEAKSSEQDYRKKLSAMSSVMVEQYIFSMLKTVCAAAVIIAPGTPITSAGVIGFTVISGIESFIPTPANKELQTPEAVKNHHETALEFVKTSKMRQLQALEEQIALIDVEKKKLRSQGYENSGRLDKIQDMLNHTLQAVGADQTTLQAEEEKLGNEIKKLMNEEEEEDKYEDMLLAIKPIEIMGKLFVFFVHKEWNYAMTNVLESEAGRLKETMGKIDTVTDDLRKLEEYQKRIYRELMPVFESMFRDLPPDKQLGGQTVVGLDVSKWKVQEALNKVKLIVEQFTKGFKVSDDIKLVVRSLGNTMDLLINTYNHIQNYQQEGKLVTYMEELNSGDLLNYHSKDKALENSLLETRIMIRNNIALIEYKRAYEAFKQFVFPYADDYLSELTKPADFELELIGNGNPTEQNLLSTIKLNVDVLELKLDDANNEFKGKFHESLDYLSRHGGVVYRWNNESYSKIISNLLSGKEEILTLDVRKSRHDALKIRDFRIVFVAKNGRDQEALDEKLKPLRISMTHMGVSYYACGKKIYSISHKSSTFDKMFDKTHKGQSDNLDKLASGYDLVSPFTTWRVQILGLDYEIGEDYLSDFKNKVDLVFEAPDANYVPKGNDSICNDDTNLSEYYESI